FGNKFKKTDSFVGNMRKPSAVITILSANIVFFILQILFEAANLPFTELLWLESSRVLMNPWILVTSMFLHAGITHIFFNMFVLLMFGPLIEQRIGTRRFYYLYFMAGIIAAIAFVVTPFGMRAVGASGAIMGILGMTIMLLPHLQVLFFFVIPMSLRTAGIIIAAVDILGLLGVGPGGIANVSHLAGLACGLAYGYYLKQKKHAYDKRSNTITIKPTRKSNEMSDDDIEAYLKHGRL
ncbi:MAG: rhomboid family intramembrane serine protease, partial [Nanobdellota archaeon]